MSSSGSGPARYLALIYLNPGQRDRLRQYESQALPVIRRHGGAFERIWSPALIPLRRAMVRKPVLVRVEDAAFGRYFAGGT